MEQLIQCCCSTITVAAADNDAPSLGEASATLSYTESGAAAVIDSALTLSDSDDTNMEGATVEITGGFVSGEDVLAFTDANGITGVEMQPQESCH